MNHFQDLLPLLSGSHREAGRIRIEGVGSEASGASFGWAISRKSIFYLFPMGSRGGSGFRGVGPQTGGTSLGWAILRNSIIYLVPMGSWGGSGLMGVGPEASGASLGWAISRNSILFGSHGETGRIRI